MSERQLTDDAVKEQAIVLLAAGFSLRDVAKQVERSHTCVWKWMQSPEFVARVNAAADALAKTMQARMLPSQQFRRPRPPVSPPSSSTARSTRQA
jgi:hypothetical protein